MAEETQEQSTGGSMKNVIIGFVSTITLGLGTWVTTKLTGGEEKEAPVQTAAPVINIQNTQNQSQAAGGKTVIINKSGEAAKPAAPVKKKEGDEFKEKPAAW
jgi:hypothetical protein